MIDVVDRRPSYRLDDLQTLLTEHEPMHWDRTKAQVCGESAPSSGRGR